MIYSPEDNDIVLNFYRSIAYKFDSSNLKHRRDSSRCRYATFSERLRFIELNKEIAKINEVMDMTVRNKNKWDKKQVPEITINLTHRQLSDFIKMANRSGVFEYEPLISKMFRMIEPERENELKSELDDLKRKYNELNSKFNSLKSIFEP